MVEEITLAYNSYIIIKSSREYVISLIIVLEN